MKKLFYYAVVLLIFHPTLCYSTEPNMCHSFCMGGAFDGNYAFKDQTNKITGKNIAFTAKQCEKSCPNGFTKYSEDLKTNYGCETEDEFLTKYKSGDYIGPVAFDNKEVDYWLIGALKQYKNKAVLSFGEGYSDFVRIIAKYYDSKAYGLDIVYAKTDLTRREILQDLTVPTSEFLKIKDLTPDLKDGVDYVVGSVVLCCVGAKCKRVYDKQPGWLTCKKWNAEAVKQVVTNAISILKSKGIAKFHTLVDPPDGMNDEEKKIFFNDYKTYYTKIMKEIADENPNTTVNFDASKSMAIVIVKK